LTVQFITPNFDSGQLEKLEVTLFGTVVVMLKLSGGDGSRSPNIASANRFEQATFFLTAGVANHQRHNP
ncbi:hypothetical protein AADX85_16885, partial [Staphylococcus epidermidis]